MSFHGGGYPPQQGYPQPGGYPPQPQGGYPPPQAGFQGGMPQPGGGGASGLPYAASPAGIGFEQPSYGGGYDNPAPQPGYPPAGYPPSAGYPQQQPGGFPGAAPGGGGYPAAGPGAGYPGGAPAGGYPGAAPGGGGYPGGAPGAGYPGGAPAAGYPGGGPAAGGYPGNAPAGGGYPGQAPGGGYSGAAPGGGYSGAAPTGGYPGAAPTGGYPGAAPAAGYPATAPSSGYPGGAPADNYPGGPAQAGGRPGPPSRPGAPPSAPSQGGYGQAGGYGTPSHGGSVHGGIPLAGMQNLNLGTKTREDGTVKPHSPFDAEKDAEVLRKAMKGFGTDEKAIVDVLSMRSNGQRQEILLAFKTMYGKDLIKELKGELGGKFETLVLALMTPLTIYDASEIKRAIGGVGTDENDLIEILCSRNNAQIVEIKTTYKKLYGLDLEKHLMSDTSGHFKRLMVSLASAGRQENKAVDPAKAKQDAKDLFDAGEARWGTDESKFNQILCLRSYEHLRVVFDEYNTLSKRTIEKAISNEMSGDIKNGLLAIVKLVRNKSAYFAEKLYKSMKGAGTADRDLIRIIVTRCEVDMVQIKQEFNRLYNKSLDSFISGDTSGDYKKMLLALVSGNR